MTYDVGKFVVWDIGYAGSDPTYTVGEILHVMPSSLTVYSGYRRRLYKSDVLFAGPKEAVQKVAERLVSSASLAKQERAKAFARHVMRAQQIIADAEQ